MDWIGLKLWSECCGTDLLVTYLIGYYGFLLGLLGKIRV